MQHTLEGLPMLEHYNSLLKNSDNESAWRIIDEYFRLFEEKDPQEVLWFMLTTALRADNEEIGARQRGNMIFFYEYSSIFFKAAHFLYKERHGTKKRKNKAG
ncbi:MAG: hypothetical protein ABI480_16220 [Chitinophagaceae bacterium]